MKAMHVRVAAVMVLVWVACGRAETLRGDDARALTPSNSVDRNSWSGFGSGPNGNSVTGKVVVPMVLANGARPVPEPSAIMLVCVGTLALVLLGRRRR
jgi:hypothetical protein